MYCSENCIRWNKSNKTRYRTARRIQSYRRTREEKDNLRDLEVDGTISFRQIFECVRLEWVDLIGRIQYKVQWWAFANIARNVRVP